MRQQTASKKKEIRSRVYNALRGPRYIDMSNGGSSNSSGINENSKNEAFEDELVELHPIKLMSDIDRRLSSDEQERHHILFWQLLRTYFDSSFRMDNFFVVAFE